MMGNLRGRFSDVTFMDFAAEGVSLKNAVGRAAREPWDVVGITAITAQIHDAAALAEGLKRKQPKTQVIVGGPHSSKVPEQTLEEFPAFDYAAVGEGEELIVEFLSALRDGRPTDSIPNLYSRRDGQIAFGGPRPFITDLDALQFPDWSQCRWSAYRGTYRWGFEKVRELPVSVNRGCPFNCIFCARFMGDQLRRRSVERVIEEIERNIIDYSMRQILFTDETFSIDYGQVSRLCEMLIGRDLNRKTDWVANTRPDMVDEPLIKLMAESGCAIMAFGADNTSDQLLETANKQMGGHHIFQAIRWCRQYGVRSQAAYIIGLPQDTEESVRRNIEEAAIRADSDCATFSILVPYPGTKVWEMAQRGEGNLVLLSRDWREYGKQQGGAMESRQLPRKKLEECHSRAYRRFYFRPRKLLSLFRVARVPRLALSLVYHRVRSAFLPHRAAGIA
jgi:radical SAM superfamily enzyme YgiQ (UPF0313 family)